MSNMMSGDNSGAEPRPHAPRCEMTCDYATWLLIDYNKVAEMAECRNGHTFPHICICDLLAAQDAENEDEATAEWLADRDT